MLRLVGTCSQQPSMAGVCNHKRPNADDPSQDNPPAKRFKLAPSRRRAVNFPPTFWDNLSRVWLTKNALRELDQRNKAQATPRQPTDLAGVLYTDLARFARHGGPDLHHLRGCPEPKSANHTMFSSSSSALLRGRHTRLTNTTIASSRVRRSSAYDNDFEQHLIDNDIYPEGYEGHEDCLTPEPCNMESILQDLSAARRSLSPSRFPQMAFLDFKRKSKTQSEGTVMRNVIPIVAGNPDIPNEGHLPFTNYASMTNEVTVKPVPDYFDGARSRDINKQVREDIGHIVIPTKHLEAPVAPNFFLEAKAPSGGADVARRQTCYNGAHGARAMHALQTYGETDPTYDGNAYTYSSTYYDGVLRLYAHHPAAPITASGRPEYHMTQIKAYVLTSERETFVQGASALRNARDLAQRHRNNFIMAANVRTAQAATMIREDAGQEAILTSQEMQEPISRPDCNGRQDASNTLQQNIASGSGYALQGDTGPAAISRHLYTEDASQNRSQGSVILDGDDPSMSIPSSLTSFDTGQMGSKRPREPHSPSTHPKRTHSSNSPGHRSTSQYTTRSPAPTTEFTQSGSSKSARKGEVLLRSPQLQEVETKSKD